jgi:hypothetical protein
MPSSTSSSNGKKTKMSFLTFLVLIFLLSLVFLSILLSTGFLNTFDDQTNNFDQIKMSLINGNKLRMVMHYNKMDMVVNGLKQAAPKKINAFELGDFEFLNTTLIGSYESSSIITITNTQLVDDAKLGLVNLIQKTSLYSNESILVQATYLSMDSSKIMRKETFNSSLKLGALYFFNQSPAKFTFEPV